MLTPYTGRTTLRDVMLIGNQERPQRQAINGNHVTNNMTYENVHIEGFEVGIAAPVRRATVIDGGYFETVTAIVINSATDTFLCNGRPATRFDIIRYSVGHNFSECMNLAPEAA